MSTHGLRLTLLFAFLASFVSGCQGVPPSPTNPAVRPEGVSSDDGSYDDTDGDGWLLFNRLLGRKPPAEKLAVQQASAVQPLPKVDELHQASPIPVAADAAGVDEDEYDDELDGPKKGEPGFDLSDLDPENAIDNFKVMVGLGPDKKLAKQYFGEGKTLYHEKRYKEAAAKFKAAAGRWPDSTLEEDALFLQGESLFFADDYPNAHDTFGNLLKKYDNSRYLDKAVLREFSIGRYWEKLHDAEPHWPVTPNLSDDSRPRFDTFGNAVKAYETVSMNDPTGPLADDSLMALGNLYFVRGRYEDAVYYYDRLRKDYPNSTHQKEAHLLSMKSHEMIYQGALYDITPLKEAGKVADQAITQFGRELGDEQGNVLKTRNKVDLEMAKRDLEMAKFYEGKRQYGAARFYYREIIKDYPRTEVARTAKDRLEKIKDFPAKPPNRFKFLTDLFPSDK